MRKKSRIYVAGHRGMVGSAIVRKLKKEGYGNLSTRTLSELDLTRQAEVEAFFAKTKPEFVFLAAARVGGIWENNTFPADFIYTNMLIQSNIIHSAWKNNVEKLLFLGSSCIYPRDCPQPMREEYLMTGPLEPTNSAYAVAKISGIEMCYAYNRQKNTQFIPVMPTNLYGPNDDFDLKTSHVLPALIRKYHLAKLWARGDMEAIEKDRAGRGNFDEDYSDHVTLWGTGSAKREFLYVDDLADACVFLMENCKDTRLVNIGVGKDITIRELADTVSGIVGYSGKTVYDESMPDGTPRKLLDVSRINELGWTAGTGLKEGIEKTYQWYRKNISDREKTK